MTNRRSIILALLLFSAGSLRSAPAGPIQVCAATPDLASIFQSVGGDAVRVNSLVRPNEDPHFVEARPGIVLALSRCQVFAEVGLELEVGWAPAALQQARNPQLLPGAAGFFRASDYISPRDLAPPGADRSAGDLHPGGSPHFLVDPAAGVLVAAGARDFLKRISPQQTSRLQANWQDLSSAIFRWLIGETLAQRYQARLEQLARLLQRGGSPALLSYFRNQNELSALGGALGEFQRKHAVVVVDHPGQWSYLLNSYGIQAALSIEERPGIAPSSARLEYLKETMQGRGLHTVIATAFYSQRTLDWIAASADAHILRLAHQTGALPCASDYLQMLQCNAQMLLQTLDGASQ
ncbi:MAG: metal ABC transporter substrate-binding protein [Leptospirales bacterium]|nr:metal ABC transporter substrate-binding protein [Leptospirales bacterium]